jgi:hypothetical protein
VFQEVTENDGGPGQSRTADLRFRNCLLSCDALQSQLLTLALTHPKLSDVTSFGN